MSHRIHIVGASGTGKTTLGRRLAAATRIPLYHLDEIARVGGGQGPLRPAKERDKDVADILEEPAWIVEGVHLGWTDPLLERSTMIIWLGNIPVALGRKRVVGRFVRAALLEVRQRRGRGLLRFRDYARQLRGLSSQLRELRVARESNEAATTAALEPFTERVVHISSNDDLDELMARLSAANEPVRREPL